LLDKAEVNDETPATALAIGNDGLLALVLPVQQDDL
jgi:hypothetical protein